MYSNDVDIVRKYGKVIGYVERDSTHACTHPFIPFPYDEDRIRYRAFEGTVPMILVTDPALLRKVLIKDSHLFINRRVRRNNVQLVFSHLSLQVIEALSGPFEHGLTALKDEAWKNARSIVSPTFSSAKLKAVSQSMSHESASVFLFVDVHVDASSERYLSRSSR